MLKSLLVLAVTAVITMMWAPSVQQGTRDAISSLTHLNYYPYRDMRRTVALSPQKRINRLPDDSSVPTSGREVEIDRDVFAERATNPIPADGRSIAHGDSLFKKLCVPCHGRAMAGDGPVAPLFMPPPDLLGQQTRERKDGFIYSYIRHGGVVMPSYGFQVSSEEAWHLVNFIRQQQKASPR
jgi:mono/diheme cytochrome c family protein